MNPPEGLQLGDRRQLVDAKLPIDQAPAWNKGTAHEEVEVASGTEEAADQNETLRPQQPRRRGRRSPRSPRMRDDP